MGRTGEIIGTFGLMKSAKTAELLITSYNFGERGRSVLVAKPLADDRDKNLVASRSGIKPRAADLLICPGMSLYEETIKLVGDRALHTLFVDEVQFLDVEQVRDFVRIAAEGVDVRAYTLHKDFVGRVFEPTIELFGVASRLVQRYVDCEGAACDRVAAYNLRVIGGAIVLHGEQVAVEHEGETDYKCYCLSCAQQAARGSGHEKYI
jgi:thymidine kinase